MEAGQDQSERIRGASPRALKAATEILARWEAARERSPLDRVVGGEFRSRHYLNSSERRWVSEAIYGCVRFLRRQRRLLEILGLPETPETLVSVWASAPAAADGQALPPLFPFGKIPPPASPEALQAALARLPGPDSPRDFLRVTLSFPDAMAAALEEQLGEEAVAAAQAFNAQAPTTLRVNTLRAIRPQVMDALPDATPTHYSPWGLELPRRVNIYDLTGFRAGWYEVQEEASQLAALLTDAQPGQTVVEVGAGAGGKTLALAALMQNQGRIVALDTAETRLEELQKRAERTGVACVEPRLLAADAQGHWQLSNTARRKLQLLYREAENVLLDAPCTGSGTLRRSPDSKWRDLDLPAFARLQQIMLTQASEFVAQGGHLFYTVCAFERAQNEAVVEAFLASPAGAAFTLVPAVPRLVADCRRAALLAPNAAARARLAAGRNADLRQGAAEGDTSPPEQGAEAPLDEQAFATLAAGPFLHTWPHRHGMDAFFMACLRRNE